jgi:superoxide dismutase, Fe-Mn family
MAFELPSLPYPKGALAPLISEETLDYHYGKHHQAYVTNLNKLVAGTEFERMSLEEIIKKASGGVFNNAAQVFNHTFFWNCMTPGGSDQPTGRLATAIVQKFGSFDEFRKKFIETAVTQFGSGWGWLVKTADGTLALEQTSNAGNPITSGKTPLLTCDVWEHAYYIDYRNRRPDFVEAFFKLVNWRFVEENFAR